MRRVPQLTLFFFFIAATIFIACQREVSLQPSNNAFDAAAAKEWYYGTFKKSAEWAASPQKGKKLPDWRHPVAGKIAGYDVVEFPLTEETKSFALPSSLNFADRQKLAAASASKIQFLRKRNSNETLVREIDYIPDFEYARGKGFDISGESLLKPDNEFKGYITVKKWDGAIEGLGVVKDNKIVKKGRILRNSAGSRPATETCTTTEFCIIQQDCIMYIYSDGMTSNECGEWYNTGDCWVEEYCIGSEGDICELFNICENGGGGDEPSCNLTSAEAQALVASVIYTITDDGETIKGVETSADADGIIRKPIIISRHGVENNWGLGYSSTYRLQFSGVAFKTVANSVWKWESLVYDKIKKVSGSTPPCFSASVEASVAGPIISADKKDASFTSSITTTLSVSCIGGGEVGSDTKYISAVYNADIEAR